MVLPMLTMVDDGGVNPAILMLTYYVDSYQDLWTADVTLGLLLQTDELHQELGDNATHIGLQLPRHIAVSKKTQSAAIGTKGYHSAHRRSTNMQ